jgi:pyocin large subunit-like protein
MNNLIRKYILGYLLFTVISVWKPFCYAQDTQVADLETIKAGDFAQGQLEAHFLKHGYQFGQITQEQYLQGAKTLLDATPGGDILEKIRYNGDIEHFRVSTGEFAVMTKRGRIRTYFKTDYGYWLRQE